MKITRRQLRRIIRELATPEPMAQGAMIQLPGSITQSHRAIDMPYRQVAAKTGDKPDRSWLTGHEYNARAEEMLSQINRAYDRFNRSWKGGGPKTQVQGWEAWPEVMTAQKMVAGERDHATLQHIYNWTHQKDPSHGHWKNGEIMFPELFTAEADKRYGKKNESLSRRLLRQMISEEMLKFRKR